jgi:hypothetical protein
MRALAASLLFMGGELRTSDEFSFELITNRDMLACNQNGIMGRLKYRKEGIEVWSAESATVQGVGWVGIFNRNETDWQISLTITEQLGIADAEKIELINIWNEPHMERAEGMIRTTIGADGVLFLAYRVVTATVPSKKEEVGKQVTSDNNDCKEGGAAMEPMIQSVLPSGYNVSPSQSIVVKFSHEMNKHSIEQMKVTFNGWRGGPVDGEAVEGAWSTVDAMSFTFTPHKPFMQTSMA